jgi:outer membrane protein assembly factor BamB
MRWTRRIAIVAAGAASIATVLGFAAPANAAYDPQALSLPWNPAGPVHSSLTGNGVVYLGGRLDGTGGIAAIDPATGDLLWTVPTNNDVRALTLSADGNTLYAGGKFSAVDGVTHRHLVAINVADHTVIPNWKAGAAGEVRDLLVYGNDLYLAGKFTAVGGVPHRGIGAVIAATGKPDPAFTFQADNDVLGLAITGSQLLLSGSFSHIGSSFRSNLAMIDLSTNTLTGWAPPKLCSTCDQYWDVQTDGVNAYVGTSGFGGFLGAFDLTTAHQPWRLISTDGDVQTLYLAGDGELYFGGHFAHYVSAFGQGSIDQGVLAAVYTATGRIDTSFRPRIYKTYPGAWAITGTPGKLWVGGDFGGEGVPNNSGGVRNNQKPFLAAYAAL